MKFNFNISIDTDNQDLHITNHTGNSVNYGDANYGNGLTIDGVLDCIQDYLLDELGVTECLQEN